MQFSEHWLRELVDPPLSLDELTHLLTMSGLEVESCEPVAVPFSGVIVGEVVEVQAHPNAGRLKLCKVEIGQPAPLQIVCGAPNVRVGMRAPLAQVGARLPGGAGAAPVRIDVASMRGVDSHGMLCSAAELGLSTDHSGLLELPSSAPAGADVREVLDLDDHVLVIKLTPNRADCLSVLGVAREVAALSGAPLKDIGIEPVPAMVSRVFPVRISDPEGCGRFTGRVIEEVDATRPTPEWMRRRLERAGQRCISALVDVTNYVMLELGRPLHVYDLDKLAGAIDVRFARSGERLRLLNEQVVALEPDVLAITDDSGPIGLAGIMGGDSTKAELTTRNVFLEAAFFQPEAIAGRARRYNFSSDASHRFERGVDFDNNRAGIERATQLILEICGGRPGPVEDVVARLPSRPPVRMRVARAQKVIGVPVAKDEMVRSLTRLGLQVREVRGDDGDALLVTPPSYRFDIAIEEDLIEEVARVHGFENIPALPPVAPAIMRSPAESTRSLHDLRLQLADSGYHEVINFSFVEPQWEVDFAGNEDAIRVLNPIASQLSVMRSTLIGGLVDKIAYNVNRKQDRIRLFEIGRVFLRAPGAPEAALEVSGVKQPVRVAAAAFGTAVPEQWGAPARQVDFFDLKGDLEGLFAAHLPTFEPAAHPAFHPGRSARILIAGDPAGWIGELHPMLQQKYDLPGPVVLFEVDARVLQMRPIPRYEEVSKYPAVTRDLSILVDADVNVQTLIDDIVAQNVDGIRRVSLFDLYQGVGIPNGKKSLAFRVLLQDTQRTLTDAEIESAMLRVRERLLHQFGAQLRGNEG